MLIKGSFAIILNKKNQILLVLRDDMPIWNLVGGGVDENETFEQAMTREAMEEICVEVDIIRQIAHYHNKDSKGNDVEIKSYFCEIQSGEPKLGNEGVCLQFFDLDKLPKNLVPKQRERIEDFIKSTELVERVQNERSTTDLMNSLEKEDFVGWEEWVNSPQVLKNYKNGELRFDILKFDILKK